MPRNMRRKGVRNLKMEMVTFADSAPSKPNEERYDQLIEEGSLLKQKYWRDGDKESPMQEADVIPIPFRKREFPTSTSIDIVVPERKTDTEEVLQPRRSNRVPKRKRMSFEDDELKKGISKRRDDRAVLPTSGINILDNNMDPLKTLAKENNDDSNTQMSVVGIGEEKLLKIEPIEPITNAVDFFNGKVEFFSAVMVIVESGKDIQKYPANGWLQCGICSEISEISNFSEHKKYGSFVCLRCTGFFQKMWKIAKRGTEAFRCFAKSRGITKGTCEINPNDEQYCETCFVRNCLRVFNVPDDMYFKLRRAMSPIAIAQNDIPAVPFPITNYPNRGKVVWVDALSGKIIHSTTEVWKTGTAKGKTSRKNGVCNSAVGIEEKSKKGFIKASQSSAGRDSKSPVDTLSQLQPKVANSNKCETTLSIALPEIAEKDRIPDKLVRLFPPVPESREEIEANGYPIIVNGSDGHPPKPLCYNCGSAGINQKWKCRDCVKCKGCGRGKGTFGRKDGEFVGCSLCYNSFHLKCAKKMPLRPNQRDKWVCASCLVCTSCGVALTKSSHHLRKISTDDTTSSPDILCLECFRRRQNGDFCPVCLSCYDDNDWDSKMMECDKCKRWIHAQCEDLNDEKYFLIGSLPDAIPYVCRLCLPPCGVGWRLAIKRELVDGCLKILDQFHKKAVCMSRKRRTLSFDVEDGQILSNPTSVNESYFTPSKLNTIFDENKMEVKPTLYLSPKQEWDDGLFKRFQIRQCSIHLTDLDVENSAKIIKLENGFTDTVLSSPIKSEKFAESHCPTTPIKTTTPNRVLNSFTEAVKSTLSIWESVRDFRNISCKLLPSYFWEMTSTDKYEDEDKFLQYFDDTLKQVFPWWRDDLQSVVQKKIDLNDNEEDGTTEISDGQSEKSLELDEKVPISDDELPNAIAFRDVYWDIDEFMDVRICSFCGELGDFPMDSCGRLLYVGPEEWVHVNCAIWSSEVWEEEDGALQQVDVALQRGKKSECTYCSGVGATLNCCFGACRLVFHFLCAIAAGCVLQTDKAVFCHCHSGVAKGHVQEEMNVMRKVYVGIPLKKRDVRIASSKLVLFVGSTKILEFGRLVPISTTPFSTSSALVPVNFHIETLRLSKVIDCGYETLQWSTYLDKFGDFRSQPEIENPTPSNFSVVIDHSKRPDLAKRRLKEAQAFWDWVSQSNRFVDEYNIEWCPVYRPSNKNRVKETTLSPKGQIYRTCLRWSPCVDNESDLRLIERRLLHPRICFIIEQLPGVENIGTGYKFKYCNPALPPQDVPACPTMSGSSRCEPFKTRSPFDMFSWLKSQHRKAPQVSSLQLSEESLRSKGLPIAMRFRNLKVRASKDLVVLPSQIHGRGLFARRDMDVGEMLIEYAGELIRSVLCDVRERKYELAGIGCYMFRVNRDSVVDATMKGNAARFINHSCDPNCESKAVKILGKDHILIFALKNIGRGEELTYDYKFERETEKLPCSCGARKCRKFLN